MAGRIGVYVGNLLFRQLSFDIPTSLPSSDVVTRGVNFVFESVRRMLALEDDGLKRSVRITIHKY